MRLNRVDERTSVLLIDDDPHTGAIFEFLMEHYQLPFVVAHDLSSALLFLQQNVPSIIIIDLFLPVHDGFQTLAKIRELVKQSNCRIMATTAYDSKDTSREVIERGFDGYIPKPFVPDSFLAYLSNG